MTVEHFVEKIAPHVKWPLQLELQTWLEPDAVLFAKDRPAVLVAGERAFEALKEKFPPV